MKQVLAYTPKEWREWLRINHGKEDKVYLVRYKRHTKNETFNQSDAMDEAICFGWIDTTLNRIDEEKYAVRFVKRNKNSRWSNATQNRAKRLIKEKRMTKAGLEAYNQGLKKHVIDHGLPKSPLVPEDLKKALSKNKTAERNFNAFAPSTRRYYLYWILKAVRDDTRKRRIVEVVRLAKDNIKPGKN